jgi:uncharacterized membrane protein
MTFADTSVNLTTVLIVLAIIAVILYIASYLRRP